MSAEAAAYASDPRLFVAEPRSVRPEWIDYNGHLNMAYYNVLFDNGVDDAFATFGLGPDYLTSGCSFFTLEAHVTYLAEIHAGDQVAVTFQILDFDDKRVHFFQEMVRLADGLLSATCEQMSMHVDMAAKRGAPFPPPVRDKIAAMAEAQRGVPIKPQVGHQIGIRRKG